LTIGLTNAAAIAGGIGHPRDFNKINDIFCHAFELVGELGKHFAILDRGIKPLAHDPHKPLGLVARFLA
jgi:hypothetical protein